MITFIWGCFPYLVDDSYYMSFDSQSIDDIFISKEHVVIYLSSHDVDNNYFIHGDLVYDGSR